MTYLKRSLGDDTATGISTAVMAPKPPDASILSPITDLFSNAISAVTSVFTPSASTETAPTAPTAAAAPSVPKQVAVAAGMKLGTKVAIGGAALLGAYLLFGRKKS